MLTLPPQASSQETTATEVSHVLLQRRQLHELRTLHPEEVQDSGTELVDRQTPSTARVDGSATPRMPETIGLAGQSTASISQVDIIKTTTLRRDPAESTTVSMLS